MLLLPFLLLFALADAQMLGMSDIRERIMSVFTGRDKDQDNFDKAVVEAIEEAKKGAAMAPYGINEILSSQEPFMAHGRNMEPREGAAKIAAQSAILLKATHLLVERFGLEILPRLREYNVTKFVKFPSSVRNCKRSARYRTFDGSCNNLNDPSFGTAFHNLRRLLPPIFEDQISVPRSFSVTGVPLPSPRLISNEIHQFNPARSPKFSLLLMQFGQLLDHEITHTPVVQTNFGGNLNCSRCDSSKTISPNCFPIPVPEDDPRFSGCLPFVRSLPGQRILGPKEQINQVTSFLDGSVFYGSSKRLSDTLRLFKGGKLRSTAGGSHLGMLLPIAEDQRECKSTPDFPCFMAGDSRSSQQPMLQTLHVIFHRHHNKIAEELAKRQQTWDDEMLYLETRRIVSAQFNHIVYNEFLPKVLGEGAISKYNLNLVRNEYSRDYNPECDAAISQSFATAAFRFGHSLIARLYPLLNGRMQNVSSPMDLVENFNSMEQIYDERAGGVDSLLMGMIASASMEFDSQVSTAVRNHLFAQRGQPKSGLDLAAINIQRGRDHGVAGYNDHREFCGNQRAMSFSSLLSDMDFETIGRLEKIYAHVNDIDLFTDAIVGPTTICLLAEQFSRLKRCDRYFYELEGEFTPEQLEEIRKTTFAAIICANSRISMLQSQVFGLPDGFMNVPMPCESFPQLDFNHWA